MKRIEVGFLERIRGGCYCYCFKFPVRAENRLNPDLLIGKKDSMEVCKEECNASCSKLLGYYQFSECLNYTKREIIPSNLFFERTKYLREFYEVILSSDRKL